MRIAVVGATGMIGSAITREAVSRGHEVTAVSRSVTSADVPAGAAIAQGDALDADSIGRAVAGHDVVIAAPSARLAPLSEDDHFTGPDENEDWSLILRMAQTLLEALPKVGVPRLIWFGGAGSLEVSPGVRVMDAPGYGEWPEVDAHVDALKLIRASDSPLAWSVFCAPETFDFGERSDGRLMAQAGDKVARNSAGESRGKVGDAAAAVVDEAESRRFDRRRFTITVEP